MDETPWDTLFVDIIGPYRICRKGGEPLIIKAVTMINPVTGWFEVTQYNYKKAMMIENFVDTTWLSRYPWTSEITYGCGYEFLGHEFKNIIIKE